MVAYVDGEWTETADARISVLDHGLLYGDGVFEGIRFYAHEPFLLDAHLDRLEASARAICLELPASHDELARALPRGRAPQRGRRRLHPARGDAGSRGARRLAPHLRRAHPDPDRGRALPVPG